MKKYISLIVSVVVLFVSVMFAACSDESFKNAAEANLVEKYGLIYEGGIWNDYMPYVVDNIGTEIYADDRYAARSIAYIALGYNGDVLPYDGKPLAQMSVNIVTETKNITRTFIYIEGANYRPKNNFRLDDGESHVMYVTIKIGNEKQTLTITGTVFTTH